MLWLSPRTIHTVWNDSTYLLNGLAFSLPLLVILLCHELGHYVMCRRYRLRCSPPYFLPAPLALGTLGAFIRIRSPIQNKRQLFDVGVSGPIAGFVALLPFLIFGLANSEVSTVSEAETPLADALLYRPGQSILMRAIATFFHGDVGQGEILNLHPVALAAWVGLLATSLNLLPLGQLDGGHILYAALGKFQRRAALPLWIGLALCGVLWRGWMVWCVIILVIGLRHPPVVDEAIQLDMRRRWIALAAAAIFVLTFMPIPISVLAVVQ
jgi:membrane-associated protease RseP (regulator of RpoE activity)